MGGFYVERMVVYRKGGVFPKLPVHPPLPFRKLIKVGLGVEEVGVEGDVDVEGMIVERWVWVVGG